MIRKKLKNGVNFSFENSNKFKTSMFVINFSVPLTNENAALYSLLSEVMKRGCRKFPSYKSISNELIDIYASFGCYVFKKGELLCFGVYDSFLDEKYVPEKIKIIKQNIDFISNFIFDPLLENSLFNNDYVEQERLNIINRIKEKINDKGSYAINRSIELMCETEPYSVPSLGRIEFVSKVTNVQLYNAYKYLIDSSVVDIYYLGSSEMDYIENSLNSILDFLPERESGNYPVSFSGVNIPIDRSVVEEIEASQGNLVLGYRTMINLSDPKYASVVLFNEILGASPVSKLFMNVREKSSLCYYCSSNLDSIKGIMLICSGIDNNNYNVAVNAIKNEVLQIKSGNITEEELSCAKCSLLSTYREIYDSPFSLINWYHTRHILGIKQTPELFSEEIQKVSIDDIINISKNIYLDMVYFLKGINND